MGDNPVVVAVYNDNITATLARQALEDAGIFLFGEAVLRDHLRRNSGLRHGRAPNRLAGQILDVVADEFLTRVEHRLGLFADRVGKGDALGRAAFLADTP